MAQFTLDDIRSAAELKYGSTDIVVGDTTIRLLNPLRLSKAKRDELTALQKSAGEGEDGAEVDQVEMLRDSLRLVAESPEKVEVLIDAVGDDLAVLAQVFASYGEGTQVGEASASAA